MLTATKSFKWEMAHMLTGHKGACANIHGHSYRMEVTVENVEETVGSGSSRGMVMEFSDLKTVVSPLVDKLDHAFMYDNTAMAGSAEFDVVNVLKNHFLKTYEVNYRPTAENMAKDFFHKIKSDLAFVSPGINIVEIKLWETETAFATYRG